MVTSVSVVIPPAALGRFLYQLRVPSKYMPRAVYANTNVLGDLKGLLGSVGEYNWTLNHMMSFAQWAPTPLYSDSYYGTAEDLNLNISQRWNITFANELHAAAATMGLLYVIAIEETGSIDPEVIRAFLSTFNRSLRYRGSISCTWLRAMCAATRAR